jgi:uncharacterized protein (DUF58 family)
MLLSRLPPVLLSAGACLLLASAYLWWVDSATGQALEIEPAVLEVEASLAADEEAEVTFQVHNRSRVHSRRIIGGWFSG